jgi:hypothetical protein
MTKYSMVLDRLRRESSDRPGAALDPPAPVDQPVEATDAYLQPVLQRSESSTAAQAASESLSERAPRAAGWLPPPAAYSADQSESYGGLLDVIRSIRQIRGQVPCVVVCGASRAEEVGRVIGGLIEAGSQRGIRVVALELSTLADGRQLRSHRVNGFESSAGALPPFEMSAWKQNQEIDAWLRTSGLRFDVVIVEAPALSDSADAALLGRELDGLVVVVEQRRTRSDHLRNATQRARGASCPVHGLVLTEARRPFPRWFARLLGAEDV